ncbi:MAG: hypothetical protein LBI14_07920 [Treponema sp.]|jgi:hypothetical protein|nr:hypothetical protein [Treponema sp.]
MSEYEFNLKKFDFASITNDKIFVMGIGGGNDVVGAYIVARLIKRVHPNSEILYGSCLSPKNNYIGFVQISEGLYVRDSREEKFNEKPTLKIVQRLKIFDSDFCAPYVLISDEKRATGRISNESLDYFKEYTIITIDNGGDSLTGGKKGDNGFDYKNLMYLKGKGISFLHIILGLGCDGESDIEKIKKMIKAQSQSIIGEFTMDEIATILSPMINDIHSPERENVDTTVIILEADNFLKSNENSDTLFTVPRHERKTQVPYAWLNKAIVFCGQKLCEVTK